MGHLGSYADFTLPYLVQQVCLCLYFNTYFNFFGFLQYILLQKHTHTHTLHLQETRYTSKRGFIISILLLPSIGYMVIVGFVANVIFFIR